MPSLEIDLDRKGVAPVLRPTLDQVKRAVGYSILFLEDSRLRHVFEYQSELIVAAAEAGLFVEAGNLPDAVIRTLGDRGSVLMRQGAFEHPWGLRPWLLTHSWTSDNKTRDLLGEAFRRKVDAHGETRHLYLVEPLPRGEGQFHMVVTEYLFISTPQFPALALYPQPRVTLQRSDDSGFYAEVQGLPELQQPGVAASALNPVITALMLMNTRGIDTQEFAPPAQKNRLLARKGKPPIPGYVRLQTADYVTAIMRGRSAPRGETAEGGAKRRSPVPHLRRGHIRHYASGETAWIRDMLVGTKNEGDLAFAERTRRGYAIKE